MCYFSSLLINVPIIALKWTVVSLNSKFLWGGIEKNALLHLKLRVALLECGFRNSDHWDVQKIDHFAWNLVLILGAIIHFLGQFFTILYYPVDFFSHFFWVSRLTSLQTLNNWHLFLGLCYWLLSISSQLLYFSWSYSFYQDCYSHVLEFLKHFLISFSFSSLGIIFTLQKDWLFFIWCLMARYVVHYLSLNLIEMSPLTFSSSFPILHYVDQSCRKDLARQAWFFQTDEQSIGSQWSPYGKRII